VPSDASEKAAKTVDGARKSPQKTPKKKAKKNGPKSTEKGKIAMKKSPQIGPIEIKKSINKPKRDKIKLFFLGALLARLGVLRDYRGCSIFH